MRIFHQGGDLLEVDAGLVRTTLDLGLQVGLRVGVFRLHVSEALLDVEEPLDVALHDIGVDVVGVVGFVTHGV
jgi:hypothetical protein